MKKQALKLILPSLLISAQSFAGSMSLNEKIDRAITKAQNNQKLSSYCDGTDAKFEEAYKNQNNSLWNQALREINEADLDGFGGGLGQSAGPLRIELGYDSNSRYYAPNKHAGQDTFTFSLGLAFPIVGQNFPIGFGLSEKREVSYTRIYESKCKSLIRIPYNPITRLPINATKALALDTGELVSYSAPLTIALGGGLRDGIIHSGLGIFRSADVQVNIFKMSDSLVRVRMVAHKDKGVSFTARLKDSALGGLKLFDIGFDVGSSIVNASLIDYIFDLKDESARETYNQLIAPHDITEFKIEDEKEKAKVAFLNKSGSVKTMLIDEQRVINAAKSNPKNVVRVMLSDSNMNASNSSFSVNFLNAIKVESRSNYADTLVSQKNEDGEVINEFFTRTIESIKRSKFFNFSTRYKYQLGTLLTDRVSNSPLGFLFQKHSNKQKLSDLSLDKWSAYLRLLPMTKDATDVDAKLAALKNGGRLTTREVFFVDAEEFFKNSEKLTYSNIKNEIREIFIQAIDNNVMLTSIPSGENLSSELKNELIEAHNRFLTYPSVWNKLSREAKIKEYEWLYSYEYNSVIANALVNISNTKLDRNERLLAFNALMQTSLFNEIGINLITRIVPADKLKKTVLYEIVMQSESSEAEPISITYGDALNKHYLTSQNAIVAKNFSLEPGADLRVYIKQDGSLKSKEDVIGETKVTIKN